ncbi:MAG TPA: S41 family peptidase [Blastocatellia bacterium]|nr:S41 family peptidase [Blastocatellia bacterium]
MGSFNRRSTGFPRLMSGLLVMAVGAAVGGYVTRPAHITPVQSSEKEEVVSDFAEALQTAEENYAGAPDLEIVGKDSIQRMLGTLDPHSTFFTKSEFDDVRTEQRSNFDGIGVLIKRINGKVYILSANPGGPAYRAGLRYGDSIISVDGHVVDEWSSEDVMQRVRGEKGEPVVITIERAGVAQPITVRVLRDEIKYPSVRLSFMIGQTDIGYIGLTGGFAGKTEEEVTTALDQLKQEGMRQLILDLRGNPGGLLDQAIKVAEKFLPPGKKILEVRGREDRFPDRVYVTPDNNQPELMPMVLLINQHTASASEVVAGALQDHSRAFIVGENSFGKGLVQSIFYLWGGTGLTLTTQRYYTPTGRSIQRDYSKVSFYDYYLNRSEGSEEAKAETRPVFYTDMGQEVFGGGGITPDEKAKSADSNPISYKLSSGVFDFVRELVAGQIAGFKEYRIPSTQYKARLSPDDLARYPVNDRLMTAFHSYISDRPQFSVADDVFSATQDYIRDDMQREIVTAAFGDQAGEEAYLGDDPQLKKAIEALPEALQLAENARRASAGRQ